MSDDDGHELRMRTGTANLVMLDALEEEDVREAFDGLSAWALVAIERIADRGLEKAIVVGTLVGTIVRVAYADPDDPAAPDEKGNS